MQLGLTPHRDDPGTWEGVQEILGESGISIVSGMFSTIGEDYTTPETIRRTGGIVPDEHWEGNQTTCRSCGNAGPADGPEAREHPRRVSAPRAERS